MADFLQSPRSLSDDALLARLGVLLHASRRCEASLVAHMSEVDARRLYRREAAPSMFAYCTEALHLSEHEAYLRITVARAARDIPILLEMLADGRLHLSGIAKLLPCLTPTNTADVLERATFRSKREIEELVAELAPRPDVPPSIRRMPTVPAFAPVVTSIAAVAVSSATEGAPPAEPVERPVRPPVVAPLSATTYRVQFTATADFRARIDRLQALMRSSDANVDLARVLEVAVSEKLARLEARRFGKTKAPRKVVPAVDADPNARYVPAPVRRAVHQRDEGRCRFVSVTGVRCRVTADLEYHHVRPWARGGERAVENLRLMCPPHNALLAERDYGRARIDRHRRASVPARPGPSCDQAVSRPPP